MLALVDHNYKFLAVDVGSPGREADAKIFAKSPLGKKSFKRCEIPVTRTSSRNTTVLPDVLGDEAFKLTATLMRPYPYEQSKSDTQKGYLHLSTLSY